MAHLSELELHEYAGGELQPRDHQRRADHLLECKECRNRLAQIAPEADAPTMPAPAVRKAPAQSWRLAEGAQLGRYLVLRRLGAGGMGVVYAAYDPELDRKVAVKVLRREIPILDSEEGRARLVREAQAMARLSHPNVIAVHDVGQAGPDVFVAMELVEGLTVSKWLSSAAHTWREIREVLSAAGEGLAAAHAAGLIHRDFKPSNVIVGHDGRVRVLDFGLARAPGTHEEPTDPGGPAPSGDDSGSGAVTVPNTGRGSGATRSRLDEALSQPGVVIGTPGYMAPEQLDGKPADARTDQFSFAVVMFEALYGIRPYDGETVTKQREAIVARRLAGIPTDRKVPVWLHRLVMRALSTDPADRFESMRALLVALSADPERRRRSLLRAWAAAAVVLATGGGLLAVRWARSRECAGAAADLGGVWAAPARERVKAGLLGSGRPFAADAWQGVERTVGEYAVRWSSQATALCESGSSRAVELERQCLAERKAEVDALVKLLEEPKGPAVENAARAAHSLTDLRRCADPEALARGPARSEDPAVAAQLAGVRSRLARAKALADSGQFAPALEELRPAQALETAARPEVLYQLGRLQERVGKYPESEQLLHQAAATAVAQGSFATAAQSWTTMAALLAARMGRPAEAQRWADYAWAAIERAGWTPELEADLRNHLGIMALVSGDNPAAEKEFKRAAELQEGLFAPSDPRLAAPLSNLGIALGRQGKLDESRAAHQRALALRLRALGPNHPEVGISENNLGTLSHRLGDFSGALAHYERAMAIALAALGPGHQTVLECQNGIALELQMLGKQEASLKVARAAIAEGEAKGRGDSVVVGDLHNGAGGALAAMGRPADAMVEYQRALEIAERNGRLDRPDTAGLLSSMALAREDLGQGAAALAQAQRAVELAAKIPNEHDEVGRAQFALARALRDSGADLGRVRAALEVARAELEQAHALGAEDLQAVEAWAATLSKPRPRRAGGRSPP